MTCCLYITLETQLTYGKASAFTDLTSDIVSKDPRAHFGKSQGLKVLGLRFLYGQLYRPEEGVISGV